MKNPSPIRFARGFTLIEILIALIIFSIGLLGLAGMQLRGSEGTNMAYFRSQATLIANDMAERMHANRAGVDATDYQNLDTNNICADGAPNPVCATRGGVQGADCSAAQMATFDLFTIACSVENLLPAGSRLTVTCNPVPCIAGSPHTVAIAWSEVDEGRARTGNVNLVVQP